MSEYPRLVHWSYYDGRGLFSDKNSRERLTKVFIKDEKGEDLLKRGNVACLNTNGLYSMVDDPYFFVRRQEGYTTRARKHGELKVNMTKQYSDLQNVLTGFNSKIMDYGEYVYIALAHLDGYVNPITKDAPFFNKNFVHKEQFNVEFVLMLINYKPRALFDNSVISSYSKEELPKFLAELKLKFPDLYKEVLSASDTATALDDQITFVGKKARIKTLSIGKVEVKVAPLRTEKFYWDGEKLTNETSTYDNEKMEQKIIPSEDMVVTICDDSVVNEDVELVE